MVMDDLLNEFLTETAESIDVVDVELVRLEQDPNNKEVLDNIFRLVHTIKGTCGFLGLPRLESVAHAAENVLGKFRDGELEVTPNAVTVILESLDQIKEILSGLEQTEEEPAGDDKDLIARLDAIITGEAAPAVEVVPEAAAPVDAPIEVKLTAERELRPGEVSMAELEAAFNDAPGPDDADDAEAGNLYDRCGGEDAASVVAHLTATHIKADPGLSNFFVDELKPNLIGLFTAVLTDDASSAESIAAAGIVATGFGDEQFELFVTEIKTAYDEVKVDTVAADEACLAFATVREAMISKSASFAGAPAAEDAGGKKAGGGSSLANQTIRVNVDLLEDLMNMVSELVLTRNQLMQMVRQLDDTEFGVPLQRLSQCTTELQESIMKTRMQPIGNAWAKLPRIVRDLNVELDKQIELVMTGQDTELDRQVLELIKDPLTHMVRNSADHGVERPAERLAKGKPEKGTIRLDAYHEGGHIIIRIEDDGAGLPVAKLKKKALEQGLASAAELDQMSDSQIQRFIFHAGFSTAKKVTAVSGRGVGMDVVRSNIEKIGGTIDLSSTEGKGTTLAIKIPLTLAIVSALIVQVSGQRFSIPQLSVLELVRASANSDHTVERIKDTPVLRLRDRLLPLVYLNEVLGFQTVEESQDRSKDDDQFIVVAQVGTFTFGIVVDQVFDTEEIVVKPVAPILKHLPIYSGNTILGDGSVIMILDPNGIATLANQSTAHDSEDVQAAEAARAVADDRETMLLFRSDGDTQKAVPLALVTRLEDIEVAKIERSDGKYVVQYRDALMPIVCCNESGKLDLEGQTRQSILVFADGDRIMGLAVDEILDIVEDDLDIEISSVQERIVGSAIIAGKATEVIDVAFYLQQAFGEWMGSPDVAANAAPEGTRVLLIDDSSFFRNMLKPLLTAAGYRVTTAAAAEEALQFRDKGSDFDLIISDIEMPGMSGFELAEAIKNEGRWADTPLVALSNRSSEQDFAKGREAGFNDYVAKFDRNALLQSLTQQLKLRGEAA
jgi:two-component system chemotaxis sensor kinase CheA